MTKKDGDKLRQMQDDLESMAADYDSHSASKTAAGIGQNEANDMRKISAAIEFLLRGYGFTVNLGR